MHFLIRAPARIHMTLIDLNGSVGRIDGGLGFGIQEPFFKVEFWDDIPNNNHLSKDLKSPLNKKYAIKIGEKVYIIREYNTHNNNDDFSQYTIYDAICYRKFNDYVEWCTSTQANCHKNIIKNYYRIKKLENILND